MAKENLFPRWSELGDFRRAWYSAYLVAMGERALSDSSEGERIRFLWLRSFDRPISVRVECREECRLLAIELSGTAGFPPLGGIEKRQSRSLSREEAESLRSRLQDADLWSGQPSAGIGFDGAQWIIEAQGPRGYIAWDVWSPGEAPEYQSFVNLCTYLIQLSGFEVQMVY